MPVVLALTNADLALYSLAILLLVGALNVLVSLNGLNKSLLQSCMLIN